MIPVHHLLIVPPLLLLGVMLAICVGAWAALVVDRGEPARFSARDLSVAVREATARALFLTVGFVPASGARFERGAVPVVLMLDPQVPPLAGYFLASYLRRRGREVVVVSTRGPRSLGLADHAERAARLIHGALGGAERCDVVAHGQAGVIAGWWLNHLGGAPRVRRLVTLATPWAGTRLSVFARTKIGRELSFEAPMLAALVPPPVPTTCFWSPDDPFVVPSASAVPAGCEAVRIDGAGHHELLLSARLFRALGALLVAAP
jgi:hypothetical protein